MIRNGQGGYSLGGMWPKGWGTSKKGKIWSTMGALKNHLNLIMDHHKTIPDDWEVVVLKVSFEQSEITSAKKLYEYEYNKRKTTNEEEYQKRRKVYLLEEKARIEKELQKLI